MKKRFRLNEFLAEAKLRYGIDIDEIRLREMIYRYKVIDRPKVETQSIGLYAETSLLRLKEVLEFRKVWRWNRIDEFYNKATPKKRQEMLDEVKRVASMKVSKHRNT